MAKTKQTEPKQVLEREYIVPLRKGWLKVPEYKRANKAIKTLKEFIVQHMKIYDRDLRKVKVNILLNNEIRFRGMRKPPARIKVKAIKYDNENVKVELVNFPKHIQFQKAREEKKKEIIEKKIKEKETAKKEAEKIKKESEKREKTEGKSKKESEEKEKGNAVKEENIKIAEQQAKQIKHTSKEKDVKIQRKALAR